MYSRPALMVIQAPRRPVWQLHRSSTQSLHPPTFNDSAALSCRSVSPPPSDSSLLFPQNSTTSCCGRCRGCWQAPSWHPSASPDPPCPFLGKTDRVREATMRLRSLRLWRPTGHPSYRTPPLSTFTPSSGPSQRTSSPTSGVCRACRPREAHSSLRAKLSAARHRCSLRCRPGPGRGSWHGCRSTPSHKTSHRKR